MSRPTPEYQRTRRARLKQQGVCVRCGRPNRAQDRVHCQLCLDYANLMRAKNKREGVQVSVYMPAEVRDAINAAVRKHGYPTTAAAVRDLPRLLEAAAQVITEANTDRGEQPR